MNIKELIELIESKVSTEESYEYNLALAHSAIWLKQALEGYLIIPEEPTDEMIEKFNFYVDLRYNPANSKENYKARHFFSSLLPTQEE
tara:strand:- start:798 stop:1061 length:264 start_codon:yes stop_codon:yes gene_type:complete